MKVNNLCNETKNPKTGKKYSVAIKKGRFSIFCQAHIRQQKSGRNIISVEHYLKIGENGIFVTLNQNI